MEVDYATNPTRLYESIQSSDWTSAARAIRLYPEQASTWVVRRDDNGDVVWRFLPLHSALARNPPSEFIHALVSAHPGALGEKDVSGMLPLHYAAGNRCSRNIMEMLLEGDAASVWEVDENGMTPLHYVGAYGCDEGVAELMLDAAEEGGDERGLIEMKDSQGMTPLRLAEEGEYRGKDQVLDVFKQCLNGHQRERVSREGLQVVTAQSPRSHAISKGSRNSPRVRHTSRGKTTFSLEEVATDNTKDKHFHHVISPRGSSSQSGEYPIHMMDSRSPNDSTGVRLTSSNDNGARIDTPGRRSYSITTRSLESPRNAPHSTTPTISNTKGFESPSVCNMKTPRSSGKGGRFGFDYPPPSPRYPQGMTSPRGTLLSPRAHHSPAHQRQSSDLAAELQRLQLENETLQQQLQLNHNPDLQRLQMQNQTLLFQSQQKDSENTELRAQLLEYQNRPTYNTIAVEQTVDAMGVRLQALMTTLQQRETALKSIIHLAEQRENARLKSYTTRKQELLKLLAAEENERQQENGYTHDGTTIGMAFGRELKGLEDARGEVGRMIEALGAIRR